MLLPMDAHRQNAKVVHDFSVEAMRWHFYTYYKLGISHSLDIRMMVTNLFYVVLSVRAYWLRHQFIRRSITAMRLLCQTLSYANYLKMILFHCLRQTRQSLTRGLRTLQKCCKHHVNSVKLCDSKRYAIGLTPGWH